MEISEKDLKKILLELIKSIEETPNDYELGEKMRLRYWSELKKIKEENL